MLGVGVVARLVSRNQKSWQRDTLCGRDFSLHHLEKRHEEASHSREDCRDLRDTRREWEVSRSEVSGILRKAGSAGGQRWACQQMRGSPGLCTRGWKDSLFRGVVLMVRSWCLLNYYFIVPWEVSVTLVLSTVQSETPGCTQGVYLYELRGSWTQMEEDSSSPLLISPLAY